MVSHGADTGETRVYTFTPWSVPRARRMLLSLLVLEYTLKACRSRRSESQKRFNVISRIFWSNYIIPNYILSFRHNLCCSILSTSECLLFHSFPPWLNTDSAGWRTLGGQSRLMIHHCLHGPEFMRIYLLSSISTFSFPGIKKMASSRHYLDSCPVKHGRTARLVSLLTLIVEWRRHPYAIAQWTLLTPEA